MIWVCLASWGSTMFRLRVSLSRTPTLGKVEGARGRSSLRAGNSKSRRTIALPLERCPKSEPATNGLNYFGVKSEGAGRRSILRR